VVILSSLIQGLRWLEAGITVGTTTFAIPNGLQEITLGVVMILILVRRPSGIMANSELSWPRARPEKPGE
jgi:branched-chain amino acid transport system permease protein